MTVRVLNKSEKAEIEKKLKGQFGISEVPGKIITSGKERLFLYSGSLNMQQIRDLEKITFIERVGIYFAKIDESTNDIRLSIEGTQILKEQITKNIFEIPDEHVEDWMKGHELNIQTGIRGFIVMKHKEDFLGTGKASENKIGNFIPKNRRLREKN
jgi:NOL1/NOP2/fmu family ribosome biogenesis protein